MRRATQADVEAASGTRVLLKDDPALVPLETCLGAITTTSQPAKNRPGRWRIRSRYPGWST